MGSDFYANNTVFAATAFSLLIMNENDVEIISTAYSSKNGPIIKKGNNFWSDDASMAIFLRNHGENNISLMVIASKSSWEFEIRIIMNPKVFIEICTGTGRHKLQLLTSSRTRTGTYFVAINNDDEMLDANYGKNNVHHRDAIILTLEITKHIESANGANNMGSNDTTFECFYALGLHRLFVTHLSRAHGENQKKVTAPEMNWNNEIRITSCNNNFMISSPHDKMFSYTRDYQLLQANNQSVLTSTFIPNHTLTHLKDSAFLFMGSINNEDDELHNKDSPNEGSFPPWMIGGEQPESTCTFESLRCDVYSPTDIRDVRMGSISESSLIKSLGDDIIREDNTLKDEQLELDSVTCNDDSPRDVTHFVFHNYNILPDLGASSIKLQSADISNSNDSLGEDSSVDIGQIIDGDSVAKSVVIDDVSDDTNSAVFEGQLRDGITSETTWLENQNDDHDSFTTQNDSIGYDDSVSNWITYNNVFLLDTGTDIIIVDHNLGWNLGNGHLRDFGITCVDGDARAGIKSLMTPILVHREGVLSHTDNSEMPIASVRSHRTDESESSFESSQTSHPSNNLLPHSVMVYRND